MPPRSWIPSTSKTIPLVQRHRMPPAMPAAAPALESRKREPLRRKLGHCAVTVLAFDSPGGQLAVDGEDNALQVWDVRFPNKGALLAEPPDLARRPPPSHSMRQATGAIGSSS